VPGEGKIQIKQKQTFQNAFFCMLEPNLWLRTYTEIFILRRLLTAHGVQCVVDGVVFGVVDAADWHTVVHACRINRCCQRVLRQL